MTREYLKDLEPEEVTERLNKGEEVYYEDSKGVHHSYKYINGICVRYTDGEVDGYGRSIYSTGECYFDGTKGIKLEPHRTYKTRIGDLAITTDKAGKWMNGYIIRDNEPHAVSWTLNKGLFYGEGTSDPRDIVEELD